MIASGRERWTARIERTRIQFDEALEKPDDAAKWQKELEARKEPEK
jgi:hypothetical protein